MAQENKRPKLTIISPSLNTGKFLRETIRSIFKQSYKNFEYIVIDGGSTDETLAILKEYPQIKWVSEKDSGYAQAIIKGVVMAQGDYVMQCCISDGYLDKDWFKKCVDALDNDREISLVWGNIQHITEEGQLTEIAYYPQFSKSIPPQKTEFVYAWLSTYGNFPEMNFCVRKSILEEFFPLCGKNKLKPPGFFFEFEFCYEFNARGYLPYFIPSIANFMRIHKNQLSHRKIEGGISNLKFNNQIKKIKKYRQQLILGRVTHRYRNGAGELLPYKFSLLKLLAWRIFFIPTSLMLSIQLFARPILKKSPRAYEIGKRIFRIFYKLRG